MAQVKKVLISLPESLLSEVDSLASMDQMNRSEWIRRAMQQYVQERKRLEDREQMIRGYQEMGEWNRQIAEACVAVDNERWEQVDEASLEE